MEVDTESTEEMVGGCAAAAATKAAGVECNNKNSPLLGLDNASKRRRSGLGLPMRLCAVDKENTRNSGAVTLQDLSVEKGVESEVRAHTTSHQSDRLFRCRGSTSGGLGDSLSSSGGSLSSSGGSLSSSGGCSRSTSARDSGERVQVSNSNPDVSDTAVPWSIDQFSLGKPLGRGKFGNVYLGRQRSSGAIVALKVLHKAALLASETSHTLRREVEIQSRLSHPNIVAMFGYFHDAKNAYLLVEYAAGGELYKHVARSFPGGVVDEGTAACYTRDLAAAVSYLHERGVAHRDIKPENVLIQSVGSGPRGTMKLKLTDFGWSVHMPLLDARGHNCTDNGTRAQIRRQLRFTMCGTPEYIAPEILSRCGHALEVDCWTLGIFLYELVCGHTPFVDHLDNPNVRPSRSPTKPPHCRSPAPEGSRDELLQSRQRTYDRILAYRGAGACVDGANTNETMTAGLAFTGAGAQAVSAALRRVVAGLLHPDPARRTNAHQLSGCDWLGLNSST